MELNHLKQDFFKSIKNNVANDEIREKSKNLLNYPNLDLKTTIHIYNILINKSENKLDLDLIEKNINDLFKGNLTDESLLTSLIKQHINLTLDSIGNHFINIDDKFNLYEIDNTNNKIKKYFDIICKNCKLKYRTYSPLIEYYCKTDNFKMFESIYNDSRRYDIELMDIDFAFIIKYLYLKKENKKLYKIIEDMSQYIYNISDIFNKIVSNIQEINVDKYGNIDEIEQKVSIYNITDYERNYILSNLEKQTKNIKSFNEWLSKKDFDIIIDGANVGFYNNIHKQNIINYAQLNQIYTHLKKQNYKPLIILHKRHFDKKKLNSNNKSIIKNWELSECLYKTPIGENDDLYWLYGGIFKNIHIVTNDKLRDHHFEILQNLKSVKLKKSPFLIWTNNFVINYEIKGSKIQIAAQKKYTNKINLFKNYFIFPNKDNQWFIMYII